MAGKQVVPREDWLAKLRAAVDRRTHLHVTARTDARAAVGLDEAMSRAKAAADVGVDAVFVEAPESIAELEAIAAALPDVVRVANMVETGKTPLLTPERAARPRLRPHRVAAVRPVLRDQGAARLARPPPRQGHAP